MSKSALFLDGGCKHSAKCAGAGWLGIMRGHSTGLRGDKRIFRARKHPKVRWEGLSVTLCLWELDIPALSLLGKLNALSTRGAQSWVTGEMEMVIWWEACGLAEKELIMCLVLIRGREGGEIRDDRGRETLRGGEDECGLWRFDSFCTHCVRKVRFGVTQRLNSSGSHWTSQWMWMD